MRKRQLVGLILLLSLLFPPLAVAQDPNPPGTTDTGKRYWESPSWKMLEAFYGPRQFSTTTPGRQVKPLNEVPENITIITSEEIEAIGAHTLVDALNYVTGVQMNLNGGPGMYGTPSIQGAEDRHVRLIIDGISMSTLGGLNAFWQLIPAQHIDKIEIIKGPASSAWGPFLGGTINVITKGPGDYQLMDGMVSTSYGQANTMDSRGEFNGWIDNIGYYLSVGKMRTGGLTPGTEFDSDNVYAKLRFELGMTTSILFTMGYNEGAQGVGEYPANGLESDMDFDVFYSTLGFETQPWEGAKLNLSLRTLQQAANQFYSPLNGQNIISDLFQKDTSYGGSAKLTWERGSHSMAMGADADFGDLANSTFLSGGAELDTWGVFANDTIRLGDWTITPGARYDHTSTSGGFFSPSIGATWLGLGMGSILRASVGRGFSIPSLIDTRGSTPIYQPNPSLKMEKVWSFQFGVETARFEHFWLKAGLFRHEIRDIIVPDFLPSGRSTMVNKGRARRQGVEVEARTKPIFNTSLYAGFSFIDARDLDTGKLLGQAPRYTGDIGIKYRDKNDLRVDLKGHYIRWHIPESVSSFHGRFDDFIWDLFLSKRVWGEGRIRDEEVFLNWRNIFNSSQYLYNDLANPGSWVEGGVRARF